MPLAHPQRRVALFLTGLLMLALPAAGRALSILEPARSIEIGTADIDSDGNANPRSISAVDPVGYGPWFASLADATARASQASLIDQAELNGTASVAAFWNWEYGVSRYRVVFSVEAATAYALDVDSIDAGFPTEGSSGEPTAYVRLRQVGPSNFDTVVQTIHSISLHREPFTGNGDPDFSGEGLLAPGTYALDFFLIKPDSHNYADNGAAGFSFMVIPEPRTGLLVLLGRSSSVWSSWHRDAARFPRRDRAAP